VDDFRVKIGFLDHPKTKRLRRRLGDRAVEHVMRLWEFATANASRREGDLTGMDNEAIADVCSFDGDPDVFVTTLTECGFLDGEPLSRKIHDWRDENPYVATWAERSAKSKRAAAARWGNSDAGGMPVAMLDHSLSNAPIPLPIPLPKKKNKNVSNGESVRAVSDHYVGVWPKRHRQATSAKVLRLIKARLAEGYSADELRLAIDGNAKSEFHTGNGHTSLELVLRDASKVDRFVSIARGEVSGKDKQATSGPTQHNYSYLQPFPED